MQVKFRGNKVAVEKNKKQNKNAGSRDGFLVMPDSEEYVGLIRYVGDGADASLQVGQKVYFSTDHQMMRIGGVELCVMEDKCVLAVVHEELTEQKA